MDLDSSNFENVNLIKSKYERYQPVHRYLKKVIKMCDAAGEGSIVYVEDTCVSAR